MAVDEKVRGVKKAALNASPTREVWTTRNHTRSFASGTGPATTCWPHSSSLSTSAVADIRTAPTRATSRSATSTRSSQDRRHARTHARTPTRAAPHELSAPAVLAAVAGRWRLCCAYHVQICACHALSEGVRGLPCDPQPLADWPLDATHPCVTRAGHLEPSQLCAQGWHATQAERAGGDVRHERML